MFLHTERKLRENILLILSRGKRLTVRQIAGRLVQAKHDYSTSALYKELAGLQDAGVVVKVDGRFSISTAWILTLDSFVNILKNSHLQSNHLGAILPAEGERRRWTFRSIEACDRFWVELMLALLKQPQVSRLYQWLPHPWHQLLHYELGNQFEAALRALDATNYVIVGGDTYLDRRATRSWSKDVFLYSHSPGPFAKETTSYVNVVDSYVLYTTYPAVLCKEIDQVFRSVTCLADLKSYPVAAIFQKSISIKMRLENNPAKAKRLRSKFEDYFGL